MTRSNPYSDLRIHSTHPNAPSWHTERGYVPKHPWQMPIVALCSVIVWRCWTRVYLANMHHAMVCGHDHPWSSVRHWPPWVRTTRHGHSNDDRPCGVSILHIDYSIPMFDHCHAWFAMRGCHLRERPRWCECCKRQFVLPWGGGIPSRGAVGVGTAFSESSCVVDVVGRCYKIR